MGVGARSRLVGLVVLVVALGFGALPVEADTPVSGRPMLRYELPVAQGGTAHSIYRDGGMSVPIAAMPGQPAGENRSLWIYGDTFERDENGNGVGFFLPGTTAAIGPYTAGQQPAPMSHVRSPNEAITVPNNEFRQWDRLIPNPTGLKNPDGSACSGYQAAWPFGATRGPAGQLTLRNGATPTNPGTPVTVPDASQLVFVTILDTCVYLNSPVVSPCADAETWQDYAPEVRWIFERFRLVAYRPADNTIVASMTPFTAENGACLPWQQTLLQPVFSGGNLYLQGSDCTSYAQGFGACVAGKVGTARVPNASMHDPTTYRWKSSSGWSAAQQDAVNVLPAADLGPIMVDVHDFSAVGEGFLLMEQTSFGGHYNLFEATSPAGPWTLKKTDRFSTCLTGNDSGCYNLYAHPELSTPGHLWYSYHNRAEAQVKLTDLG
jgi:hypothetical protein